MGARPQAPPLVARAAERPILSQPSQQPTAHAKVERHAPRDGDGERDAKHGHAPIDPLDPAMRNPALVAPVAPAAQATAAEAVEAPRAKMSMEELLPALVRRIAWAGDKNKGTVRLELGAGAQAGTTLLVHAEGGRVRVEVHGVEGRDLDDFRRRLDSRLRGHGLDVESVS
ncbi:MAG TPA: hypothetical protein VIF62_13660 [Labilithrix sp.]